MLRPTNGKHSAVIKIEKINEPGVCSAFVVSDELAVTAAHCLTPPVKKPVVSDEGWKNDSFRVYNSVGENLFLVVKPIWIRRFPDFATLQGNFKDFNKLKLKVDSVDIKKGHTIYVCGFPGGIAPAICNVGELTGTSYFSGVTNAYMSMGMSGGPVFDKDYRVIGLNASRQENGDSLFSYLQGMIRIEDE